MKLYLDEDLQSRELIRTLRKTGHDVLIPSETYMMGESDAAQLTFAITESRACVTGNHAIANVESFLETTQGSLLCLNEWQ